MDKAGSRQIRQLRYHMSIYSQHADQQRRKQRKSTALHGPTLGSRLRTAPNIAVTYDHQLTAPDRRGDEETRRRRRREGVGFIFDPAKPEPEGARGRDSFCQLARSPTASHSPPPPPTSSSTSASALLLLIYCTTERLSRAFASHCALAAGSGSHPRSFTSCTSSHLADQTTACETVCPP